MSATTNQGQVQPRTHRRRRCGRKKPSAASPAHPVEGFLHVDGDGHATLIPLSHRFLPHPQDPLVEPSLLTTWHLKGGLRLSGEARRNGNRLILSKLVAIEGMPPEVYRQQAVPFSELTSIDPTERFRLETTAEVLETRVVELLAPIGKGQRCLIVAPPKAGKTPLLQQLAHAIATNHPEVHIFVLLVDERPEEVTAWVRSVIRGEVFASSSDQDASSHIAVSEMVLERARRLVELGQDVVVFMDSLTRMSRAYNNVQKGSGRILSGGIDARTMEKPRRFFGSARNVEHGGSLTIVATCLVDTGSRMDEVIFQEFKGTGNMEIVLTRDLFERRIFPCIHIASSGTRKEEKLYSREEVEKLYLLRRALAALPNHEAMQLLLSKLRQYPTNQDFLASFKA
ncbi:MAG: transcription termination factor Rho [Thermoanaerobaculum sp.]|nr:transcription termination factor Rho [Thermoanaerobaculum sp.]